MRGLSIFVLLPILLLAGCSDGGQTKITELEKQTALLTKEVEALKKLAQAQKTKNLLTGYQIDAVTDSAASVDTTSRDFSIARNIYGQFTVLADKVEPYMDGYKVTARVGNLSSATFTNAKLKVSWGKYGFEHEKTFNVTKEFLPGRYTVGEFILTPAKAEEVKTINVGVNFEGTKLFGPVR